MQRRGAQAPADVARRLAFNVAPGRGWRLGEYFDAPEQEAFMDFVRPHKLEPNAPEQRPGAVLASPAKQIKVGAGRGYPLFPGRPTRA